MSQNEIMVNVAQSKIAGAVGRLLEDARATDDHQRALLAPRADGSVVVTLWDADPDSEDPIRVRVRSTLTWRERCLRHGVEGLPRESADLEATLKAREEGRIGLGAAIPTQRYLEAYEKAYGHDQNPYEVRTWTFPHQLARDVQRGRLTPLEALEKGASSYLHYLEAGGFKPFTTRAQGQQARWRGAGEAERQRAVEAASAARRLGDEPLVRVSTTLRLPRWLAERLAEEENQAAAVRQALEAWYGDRS